ncbi:MAG: signal transduction histidine kinase [Paraglaciecola sp.]|jgi:signal transduction histidine kinase
MDIYLKKSRWKIYLAVAAMVILAISSFYSSYLANEIAKEERNKVALWHLAQEQIRTLPDDVEQTLHLSILSSNKTIPAVLLSYDGYFDAAINFGESLDYDTAYIMNEVEKMKRQGIEPTKAGDQLLYVKQSRLLTLVQYFPLLQLLLIGSFILFGYLAFSSARRAEENRVWVGMAKETAHQLGTPISGILGWINHIQMIREDDEEMQEIVLELGKDVNRLELVADRFSKIGSAPELKPVNAYKQLEQMRVYMQRRAPRKVNFHFPNPDEGNLTIHINAHLFDWVVENLMRNALDSMGGKGAISAEIYEDPDFVYMDISDTGGGIPTNKFRTVFRPGFTTKKRGWGLGLSLAKRIIEEYHSGKIFVKKSLEGEGTTFTIQMPKK